MGSWAKGAGPDRRSVRRSRLVRFGRHIFDWQLGATRSCVFETVKSIRYHAMSPAKASSQMPEREKRAPSTRSEAGAPALYPTDPQGKPAAERERLKATDRRPSLGLCFRRWAARVSGGSTPGGGLGGGPREKGTLRPKAGSRATARAPS